MAHQNQPPISPQGSPSPQPHQPPKRKHTIRNILGIALAVIVGAAVVQVINGGGDASTSTQDSTVAATTQDSKAKTVKLTATESGGGATVVWGPGGSMNTEQFTGQWTKEIEVKEGDYMNFSVTGDITRDDDSQEVSCELVVNGKAKESNTATGRAGTASCTVFDIN